MKIESQSREFASGNLPPSCKWLFRFLAAFLVPCAVFCLAEVALRTAGFGYRTSFFVPHVIKGSERLVANSAFGMRFFPPALARSPSPVVMSSRKPPGVCRIFLFGESAALGDPRPAFGVGRFLETLLRERYPGTEFEVVCTAMTAINSHAILPIARECVRYDADLWIIYMGNNEMAGPFGANTVFGTQALPGCAARAYLQLQRTRTGQWLASLARKFSSRQTPAIWDGLKMFQQSQLAPDDPRRARVYANFRRNLDSILKTAAEAGVPVVLSSVASNLKDCAPFSSKHATRVEAAGLGPWVSLYQSGITIAQQGRWDAAAARFQEAARQHPEYAELRFRLGQSQLALGRNDAARAEFAASRDLDALPFRADSTLNGIIEEAALRWAGKCVAYLDAEQALAAVSPDRIPGKESFYEHVHLHFDGNYRLAVALAEQAVQQLPPVFTQSQTPSWATAELCARRLGLTDWNRSTAFEEMIQRLSDAPFTNQLTQPAAFSHLTAERSQIRERLQSEARDAAHQLYEEALRARPDDPWLHHNYAEFLAAVGDPAGAAVQMSAVRDLLPFHHAAYLQVGRLLARQKRFEEAARSVEAALRLRPDLAEGYLELGQIRAEEDNADAALKAFEAAQKLRPNDAKVYLLRASLFERSHQRDQAIASLWEAVRVQPSSGEARYLLGAQLLLDHQFSKAETQLKEAVRLRPDHAAGHLNLGFALAQQQRFAEAVPHFREALRLEPANTHASQFLATAQRLSGGTPQPASDK